MASLVNKSVTPATVNSSLVNQNLDLINQASAQPQAQSQIVAQTKFKNNLNEYFGDLLRTKLETHSTKLNLGEIVQSVLSRKNYQIVVNQQLRHVFQWILDLALNLIHSVVLAKQNQGHNGDALSSSPLSSLLGDTWALNEIRKALIYMKLLFICASTSSQQANTQAPQTTSTQQSQSHYFITSSLPVLPLKSSMQRDLINELFNIYTRFLIKNLEGSYFCFVT